MLKSKPCKLWLLVDIMHVSHLFTAMNLVEMRWNIVTNDISVMHFYVKLCKSAESAENNCGILKTVIT